MRRGLSLYFLFSLFVFLPKTVLADSGNKQIELVSAGRYDALAVMLETQTNKMALVDRHALCYAYSKLKNYSKLLDCLDVLERQARTGDRSTRLFGLDDVTPAIFIMRAEAQVDLGLYKEAKQSAQNALDWYSKTHSDDNDVQADAFAVLVLASVFDKDVVAAEAFLVQLEMVDVSWPRFNAYANSKTHALARAHLALRHYDKVLQVLGQNRAFALQVFLDNLLSGATFRGTSNWIWQDLPRGYMAAKAMKELGRVAEAIEGYDQLLRVKQINENGEIYWLVLYDRGRIAEQQQNKSEAVAFYRRAIDVLEVQRASINTLANKIGFIGNKQEVYEHIVRLLLEQGQTASALEYVVRSKSRALVDMLAEKMAQPDFIQASYAVNGALTGYIKAEEAVRLHLPQNGSRAVDERRGTLKQAEQILRETAQDVASLAIVDKIHFEHLQSMLSEDETLVEYYLTAQGGYAFLVSRTALHSFPIETKELGAEIEKLRVMMEQRDTNVYALLKKLNTRLIEPFSAHIKTPNLLIVPHGVLHYLSFAALTDGKKYLVERFGLRSLPSASLMQNAAHDQLKAKRSILVLGNPDLDNSDHDLPNAEEEAKTVAKIGPSSELLVRKKASETAVKKMVKNYSAVHIASHGKFDTQFPLNSALLLAKDDINDGLLTVAELYSLKLNADLVTLSACVTGVGHVANGDDMVGLSRGFLFAGARSIVATLWDIDDFATAYLMERFYTELNTTTDKRKALRKAQLETKKRFVHPFYWAAFYLIGSDL